MKRTIDFLKLLAANNNRDWFNEHKEDYLMVKNEVEDFTQKLIDEVAKFEPAASYLTPSECLYRIYRDTRFSADKTPYKNHIGIYINPRGGKKSEFCGYYVHIEPGDCLVAGGAWFPESPLLKVYRSEIYNNVEEYLGIINNPDFAANFKPYWQEPLKTAPKGFPKDWVHMDLIKPKSFVFAAPLADKDLTSKNSVEKIANLFRILKPYDDFFNFSLEQHPQLAERTPKRR